MEPFDLEGFFSQQGNIIAGTVVAAKIQKAYYDSLIGEGFSEEQAMFIMRTTIRTIPAAIEVLLKTYSQ